jgi:hypothetical protein
VGGGDEQVFLCHGYCEVGATLAEEGFRELGDFLTRHPSEVVIMSIEDDTPPGPTIAALREAGLLPEVWTGALDGEGPTLREMIDRDERLLVLVENEGGAPAWYRSQEAVTEETPYTFGDLAALGSPASCAPNRGGTGKPLFLMNHWIETTPAPRPTNARRANARGFLLDRIRECRRLRGRLPTIVAVDFYREGDLIGVVRQLNREATG